MGKFTIAEKVMVLQDLVEDYDEIGGIPAEEILDYLDEQLRQVEKKAARARNIAIDKKALGDPIYDELITLLDDTWQSTADLVNKSSVDDNTESKISARITRYYNQGKIDKVSMFIDGKRRMMYRLKKQQEENNE